ncbi:hypothetical protein RCOM_0850070 [Ricinus communis]|uniref:Uncharacterized protein n=1 Tax=Ricinus communis TaxID=3988 RepID=B9SL36_RICCO|nr:hypothetical protein RCOM_0850070 [Ricinus communis]
MGKSLADLRKIYSRATKNLKASKYPRPTSRFQEERTEKKMEGSCIRLREEMVLVGQMYYSGYGIPRDAQKGKIWMTRASKTRSSVWRVSDKHPGYNASDSDSDELKCDS